VKSKSFIPADPEPELTDEEAFYQNFQQQMLAYGIPFE